MTTFTTTSPAEDQTTETAVAVTAGMMLAEPVRLEIDEYAPLHTVLVPAGATLQILDARPLIEQYALNPRRKTGAFTVYDAPSFIDYLAKHGVPNSEVWANPDEKTMTGVINAHDLASDDMPGMAGHGDHRVVLKLVQSHQWKAWVAHDGKMMARDDFAEFIEDNAVDVVSPDSATMLEIAQGIHATMSAEFKNAQRLSTGEVSLQYEETINATAGHKGGLEIPTSFLIEIPVFVGSAPVTVSVRFRYRLRGGNLTVGYKLERPYDIIRAAFEDTADTIQVNVAQPVFLGVTAP